MKKYIEEKYQQLINDMERAYDATINTLNYHISQLQRTIREQSDELEQLKGGDKLADEIAQITMDDSNVVTVESCPGCDAVADELREKVDALNEENARLKKELQGAKISAGRLKANKTKKKSNRGRYVRKSVVCQCKDCDTYFEAKSKNAKYCSSCKAKRERDSHRRWAQKNV